MTIAVLDDEEVVVRTPDEFHRMPRDYQKMLISQVTINTEGELSGGDDYVQMFLPLAPDAEERQVCAERAAEEYDHYKIGKRVLADLGIDTTYMETQAVSERMLFADERMHTCTTWAERGVYSYIGEETAMVMLREFAESSYKPWAEAVRTIILDEKIHIAHGARVCRNLAATEEGRTELQAALDRLWPMFVGIFGSANTKRSKLAVRYGLRRTTNGEAIEQWRQKVGPRVANLGLRVPE
ncbi:Phenylacetic acid catabolic protein [Streptomyces qinglanensis]|uniref:Ring-1,2-phenylacetyl-CoA epoxidase subunit PaaA n=1 Tax=Streptomyces qinglanensis TaxID=943816 RepID=A0A1H9QYS0_9ACTN|nr:Phenylacetic acid catabolic protein [Streptomyces qinglanensis]SER64959.1 ring-1,2-phenylacetyl-CoA epoxidase subunit PaaA [Streptomyces qinglanensis]